MNNSAITPADIKRRYRILEAAAVAFGKVAAQSERSYWMVRYKQYKDALWQAEFETLTDWIEDLQKRPQSEGGCAKSTFYAKMDTITQLVKAGCPTHLIAQGIATVPGAMTKLAAASTQDLEDRGTSKTQVLEEAVALSRSEAMAHVASRTGEIRTWLGEATYEPKRKRLELKICTESNDERLHRPITMTTLWVDECPQYEADWIMKKLR